MSAPARNVSVGQAALNVIGAVLSFVIWNGRSSPSLGAFQMLTGATGVATLLLLRRYWNRWTEELSAIFFIGNLVPIFGLLWADDQATSRLGHPWVPFQASKLSLLAIALLAPGKPWLGLLSIIALAAMAIVQYEQFAPGALRLIVSSEPWVLLAFAGFAIVLLWVRINDRELHRRAAQMEEKARMMARLAKTLLAIRDLANTPIQTLMINLALLKRKHPETSELSSRMERSVQDLSEVSDLLSEALSGELETEDYESLNAREVLRSLMIAKEGGEQRPRRDLDH